MRSYSIHRFLIQGFIALLLANVVQPSTTIRRGDDLANEVPLTADIARSLGRIVNGTEAINNQFPHLVSLRYTGSGKHFCGGSIIDAEWIVTAASCLFTLRGVLLKPEDITVVAGDLWLNETWHSSQRSTVAEVILHDEYDASTFENDIALLQLAKLFTFGRPAVQRQILRTNPVPVGTTCQVAGWGYTTYYSTQLKNELMYVDVPIVDQPLCADLYMTYAVVTDGMICAGYAEGLRDACDTDSGGGLICDDILTGIASWGRQCAAPNSPRVYTDVRHYQNWISERVPNVTVEANYEDSGAGNMKFSFWMLLLSFALVGLVTRS